MSRDEQAEAVIRRLIRERWPFRDPAFRSETLELPDVMSRDRTYPTWARLFAAVICHIVRDTYPDGP